MWFQLENKHSSSVLIPAQPDLILLNVLETIDIIIKF